MNSAGVDYGVRRIAYAHPHVNVFEELILPSGDDLTNIYRMATWLKEQITKTRPELTVIEQPIQGVSRNVRTGLSLGMVAGALSYVAQDVGSKVVTIGPSSWKKAVIGNGHADKQAVAKWLETRHPSYYEYCLKHKKPQDIIDSTCLALYGEARLA